MIKLKDIVKQLLTEKSVEFCRQACTTATDIDKTCYQECRKSGMAPGDKGGLLGQAATKRPSHSQFGPRQPRTTRLQRKSISQNRYRR